MYNLLIIALKQCDIGKLNADYRVDSIFVANFHFMLGFFEDSTTGKQFRYHNILGKCLQYCNAPVKLNSYQCIVTVLDIESIYPYSIILTCIQMVSLEHYLNT